ncbi:MAG TPA: HAD-IA family hydrolase [Planctomycetota bacterium]|nr:HAD-IA family hydrolase [Planctomycetota bacterium]
MSGAQRPTFLFDLDGTLIDSVDLILASYRHTLRIHRGIDLPPEHFRPGLGRPLVEQLALITSDPGEVEAMVASFRDHNREHHDRGVSAYPGVDAALLELARGGATLGIVSSKNSATAWRGLECCGLAQHFEVLIGSDDVSQHKPHPAPVLAAMVRLDARAATTVFIGDSPQDLEAGRRAGVRTAAAAWGPFDRAELEPQAPDVWLASPSEILSLLDGPLNGAAVPSERRSRPPDGRTPGP